MTEQHSGSGLTEYEEQLYDRSIRLWGLEAQKRYDVPLLAHTTIIEKCGDVELKQSYRLDVR